MRRAILIAFAVGLLFPAGASACSIAAQSTEERVRDADVAVYGKVVAKRKVGDRQNQGLGERYRYRFRVIETYKGHVRRRIRLHAWTAPGACGVELEVGERHGLLLEGRRGPWQVGIGSFISRSELRRARSRRR